MISVISAIGVIIDSITLISPITPIIIKKSNPRLGVAFFVPRGLKRK